MMMAVLGIGTILLLASSFSFAIILRPRWYPYFPRHNQVARGSSAGSDLSALTAETMESRHVRMAENREDPICNVRLTSEECLNELLVLVARLLKSGIRGNSYLEQN